MRVSNHYVHYKLKEKVRSIIMILVCILFMIATIFRRGKSGSIHDDYYLGARCLVNGGFPITFYGNRHEVAPQRIQITIGMLVTILFAVSNEQPETIPSDLNKLWRKYR